MKLLRISNQRGLSLLEVLISMVILAFGLLGLAPMFTLAVEGNVISRDTSVASNLINEKIEQFQMLDSLPSIPYRTYEYGIDSQYTRATFLNDNSVDTTIPAGVAKLDVVVTWVDHQAVSRSSMYSTYLIGN
jgi:prepilin-type N-terminal cleavage/methylation domain-containing protein